MVDRNEPTLRITPRPADININGNIFGGWILSQMDIAGGVTAARLARGPVATVAVDAMKFVRPMLVGDLVSIYTTINNVGLTSISIDIEVFADRSGEESRFKVTEGLFVFVAVDAVGNPRPVYDEET